MRELHLAEGITYLTKITKFRTGKIINLVRNKIFMFEDYLNCFK